jgi:acyl-CoA thioesterase-1
MLLLAARRAAAGVALWPEAGALLLSGAAAGSLRSAGRQPRPPGREPGARARSSSWATASPPNTASTRGTGWVALLSPAAGREKTGWHLRLNASISGDTTAGAWRACRRCCGAIPRIVMIELGATTACAACPLAVPAATSTRWPDQASAAGARGCADRHPVPPNYGRQYNERVRAGCTRHRRAHKAALVPFMLKGVADRPDATTGSSPITCIRWQRRIRSSWSNIWPALQPLLEACEARIGRSGSA